MLSLLWFLKFGNSIKEIEYSFVSKLKIKVNFNSQQEGCKRLFG